MATSRVTASARWGERTTSPTTGDDSDNEDNFVHGNPLGATTTTSSSRNLSFLYSSDDTDHESKEEDDMLPPVHNMGLKYLKHTDPVAYNAKSANEKKELHRAFLLEVKRTREGARPSFAAALVPEKTCEATSLGATPYDWGIQFDQQELDI